MTTIAMMTPMQVGATLLAIITAVILAATASVVATPPDFIHGRRCFRATTTAGSAEAILAAVDSIFKVRGRADLGVRGNDVLNQAVGEIILFGICRSCFEKLGRSGGLQVGTRQYLPVHPACRRCEAIAELFFRQAEYLSSSVLRYLCSLDRASTHCDGNRHDSQTSHFSDWPDPGFIQPQSEWKGEGDATTNERRCPFSAVDVLKGRKQKDAPQVEHGSPSDVINVSNVSLMDRRYAGLSRFRAWARRSNHQPVRFLGP